MEPRTNPSQSDRARWTPQPAGQEAYPPIQPAESRPLAGDDQTLKEIEDQIEHDEMAEAIEVTSPEGRPAHPRMGPWQVAVLIAGLVGALLIVGLIMALTGHVTLGVAVAAVGVILFLVNPAVWAGVVRSAEWSKAARYRDQERAARIVDDALFNSGQPLRVPPRRAQTR